MIKAKIIKDSITEAGKRITTFELEYPRFIHSELMTHRLFSRNAASSRAIPIEKMLQQIATQPAMPIEWGLNKSGMQADEALEGVRAKAAELQWKRAAQSAVEQAKILQDMGLHKQIVNRVLEPFQMMKTVVTATEFDNFFWLRKHSDAQPEIHALAISMYECYSASTPQVLKSGEWHLPYVESVRSHEGKQVFPKNPVHMNDKDTTISCTEFLTLEEALKVSASCCAQVSYRKTDDSLEKALKIYGQLVTMSPVHASPFEHQATPISSGWPEFEGSVEEKGVTHADTNGRLWSGNFKGWIQYRQLIRGNTCWDFEETLEE